MSSARVRLVRVAATAVVLTALLPRAAAERPPTPPETPAVRTLRAVEKLMAGRQFRGEDGYRQAYGDVLPEGDAWRLEGHAIRPDGSLVVVVDRLLPEPDGLTLVETVAGAPGARVYHVAPRAGGGFIVRPRGRDAIGPFVSRECREEGPHAVCIKVVRLPSGDVTELRYVGATPGR